MKASCDSEIAKTAVLKSIKARADIIARWTSGESLFPISLDLMPKTELDKLSLELAGIIDRLMEYEGW
jgi:hypothetical protein